MRVDLLLKAAGTNHKGGYAACAKILMKWAVLSLSWFLMLKESCMSQLSERRDADIYAGLFHSLATAAVIQPLSNLEWTN